MYTKKRKKAENPVEFPAFFISRARSGTRTRTNITAQGILSPSCLPFHHLGDLRAENEARTRDPNLGKVVLYQLSYFRVCFANTRLSAASRQNLRFAVSLSASQFESELSLTCA